MFKNMNNYIKLDPDDDHADFRYNYRDIMIAQLKQDLCNRNFSLQNQGKGHQNDTLQNRIKFWPNFTDMGVQFLIIFLVMIITTKDWMILFAVQIYLLRLENSKNCWTYSDINDSENKQFF